MQMVLALAVAVTGGDRLTFTVTSVLEIHPLEFPVTVYVVVNNGLAVTVSLVVEFNPPEGDQE